MKDSGKQSLNRIKIYKNKYLNIALSKIGLHNLKLSQHKRLTLWKDKSAKQRLGKGKTADKEKQQHKN